MNDMQQLFMSIEDAAYHTAHDYPGKTESLAPRMGMPGAVLRNKVNPGNDRNHLTLDEAVRMMELTDDHRILHALANYFGYVMHANVFEPDADSHDLLSRFNQVYAQIGDFARHLNKSIDDGELQRDEDELLQADVYKACALLQQLLPLVRQIYGKAK